MVAVEVERLLSYDCIYIRIKSHCKIHVFQISLIGLLRVVILEFQGGMNLQPKILSASHSWLNRRGIKRIKLWGAKTENRGHL